MRSVEGSKLAAAGERRKDRGRLAMVALLACGAFAATAASADEDQGRFPLQFVVSSTIPSNGDLNPYGIVFVPRDFPSGGKIAPGDVLVSNFNNFNNLQGTGVTIIKFTPAGPVAPFVAAGQAGTATTFFTSKLHGLTTALGILRKGFVIVGNLPSTDGTFNTHGPGFLQVIDRNGNLVKTLKDAKFLGPWGLAINDEGAHAQVFVSDVVTGTVVRIDLSVSENDVAVLSSPNVIAKGYAYKPDPVAFELGPTGLAFDKRANTLYVASTLDNAIYSISAAGTRTSPVEKGEVVFEDPHLRGPLGLVLAPNGDLITANGDAENADPKHPSGIVEFTKRGKFVVESNIDASIGGAFGIAVRPSHRAFTFAAVDDVPNTVTVFNAPGADFSVAGDEQ